ncbi:hypothetical protein [Deinococcus radiophilus]|uniref:hypothetical protein n=1 Tax=Deinococcus radiophilus TaxID=32062 RepID=UPI003619A602
MTQTTTTVYLAHLNPDDDTPTLGNKVFFTQAEAEQDLMDLALSVQSGITDDDLEDGEENDLFHPEGSPLEKLQASTTVGTSPPRPKCCNWNSMVTRCGGC